MVNTLPPDYEYSHYFVPPPPPGTIHFPEFYLSKGRESTKDGEHIFEHIFHAKCTTSQPRSQRTQTLNVNSDGMGWAVQIDMTSEVDSVSTISISFIPGAISRLLDALHIRISACLQWSELDKEKRITGSGTVESLHTNIPLISYTSEPDGLSLAALDDITLGIVVKVAPAATFGAEARCESACAAAIVSTVSNGISPRIDVEFILPTEPSQKLTPNGMSVFGITSLLKGKSIILDQLLNDHFEQMEPIIDWTYPEDEDYRRITLTERLKNSTRSRDSSNPPGRRCIRNVAYRTFKALVEYIYTGQIVFGTGKDTGTAPKSMYRLAEALRMRDLQAKALAAYAEQLNKTNVVEEAFSEYTSRYAEVMQVIAKALKGLISEEEVKKEVSERIDRMACGEMPHAAGMVKVLIAFV